MDDEVRGEAQRVLERWLAVQSEPGAGNRPGGEAAAPVPPTPEELLPAVREALAALREQQRSRHRRDRLPVNVGKPWTADQDAALLASFDAGLGLEAIAAQLQRTRTGIRARLERHGRITPAPPP
jgi:hypothetical protein